jgi:signal transduction histidine kinase
LRETTTGLVVGAAAIAVASVLIALLKGVVHPLGLTSLYLLAIFPIAIRWGFLAAGIAAVASFLTYEFFFVSPLHSLRIADSDTGGALLIAIVTAYVVSELARRAHERAREAEQAQHQSRGLAAEQEALRRVATLVAQGVGTGEVFEAVTREVGMQCDADLARMERFEPDGTVTALAAWSRSGEAHLAVGTRFALEGASIAVRVHETGRPARVDSFVGASGPIADEAQELGIRSSVGCPLVVGGQTWGVIAASTTSKVPFPPDTESRIAEFTALAATAIANAQANEELRQVAEELRASRARIVATADETRRRIERDLHDGAQQRLVSLALQLGEAQAAVPPELPEVEARLKDIGAEIREVLDDLQEMGRGLHPAILAQGGLGPALKTLARRSAVPVGLDVNTEGRLPEHIEIGAYYVVSEALTNAAKHADASSVAIEAEAVDGVLRVSVRDDGVGGADFAGGSGLVGLKDRVEALGGRIAVESAAGAGTSIRVELPLSE